MAAERDHKPVLDVGHPRDGWSAQRIEALRVLAARGDSAATIAGKLGGLTRNAVIGKCQRAGIPLEPKAGGGVAAAKRSTPRPAPKPARHASAALFTPRFGPKPGPKPGQQPEQTPASAPVQRPMVDAPDRAARDAARKEIDAATKTEVEDKIRAANDALASDDAARMATAQTELDTTLQKIGTAMYGQAGAAGAAPGAAPHDGDDTVEGEFREAGN